MKLTKNAQDSPKNTFKWNEFYSVFLGHSELMKTLKKFESMESHRLATLRNLQHIFLNQFFWNAIVSDTFSKVCHRDKVKHEISRSRMSQLFSLSLNLELGTEKKMEEWNFPGISSPVVQFSKFISRSARPHFIPIFFLQPRPLDAPSSSLGWPLLVLSKNFFLKQNALA